MDLKYALYARKSTESDERQAMSIDSQVKEMMAVAEREGITVQAIKRESHSAKQSATRPIFLELVEDLRTGKYDALLTWAPDRLSRNAGDLGALVDLMDAGKLQEIRTYGQSFRNNPNEKFLLMILCSQAKLENDNKGITIKRGMRARAALGWRPGNIPIGYLNRSLNGRKDIVIDPERAEIIKEIFERVAVQKHSGRQVKRWLDEMDFRSKRGSLLSLSQVYNILSNNFYFGEFEYPKGGELRIGTHQPLVTKETFLAARRTIDEQRVNRTEWGSRVLPYRKVFVCGACGNHMTVEQQERYIYYRCSGYTKEKGRCDNPSLSYEEIVRQTITSANKGVIKRTSFIQTFNMLIDEHYRVTVSIMEKKGIQHSSNTRLRDYINYVFTVGSIEQQEEVFRNLLVTPAITNKKIIFIKVVSMDT
ncbi:MAG: recombinase family protein [Candidatus Microsaccharimonas sp.]